MKRELLGGVAFTLVALASSFSAWSQTNIWTNQVTGAWEDLRWSLGVRPNISQAAVMVTNYGQKAIIIGPGTVNNYPSTMTISNLSLGGTSLSTNTLLLNYTGTVHPLRVKESLNVWSNSVLLNLNGSLVVEGTNAITQIDGIVSQDGGSNVMSGFVTFGVFAAGFYNLTNGSAEFGHTHVGDVQWYSQNSAIAQYGGLAQFESLSLSGQYVLSNGTFCSGEARLGGYGAGYFQQSAGNVIVTNAIAISYNYNESISSYALWQMENGSLTAGGIGIGPANGTFDQLGGSAQVGSIFVDALIDYDYGIPQQGKYRIHNGILKAGSITRQRAGVFEQSGGTITVAEEFSGGMSQTGGFLYCSNISYFDPYLNDFLVANATNVVTNTLVVGPYSSVLNLQSGMVECSNIVLVSGHLYCSGASLINRGQVEVTGGRILCNTTNQEFGKLVVGDSTFADLEFGTNRCVMKFKDSSDVSWSPGATLYVWGWNGSTNGGGATQLYIGNSDHGLTHAQLSQIIINSTNYARQLPSGEIVPTAQPTVAVSKTSTNLLISWPRAIPFSLSLQSSTNVNGPYNDVPNADQPYIITPTAARQFFRLAVTNR